MFSAIAVLGSFFSSLGAALIFGAASGVCGAFVAVKKETASVNIIAIAAFTGILSSYALFGSGRYIIAIIAALFISLIAMGILKLFYGSMNASKFAVQSIILASLTGICVTLYSYLYGSGYGINDAERLFLGSSADMIGSEAISVSVTAFIFLLITTIFFKRFEIIVFDRDHARSVGINIKIHSAIFKILSVLLILNALQVTGVFLTGAVFIFPFLTVRLLVSGFGKTVVASALLGAFVSLAGTAISGLLPFINSGPAIAILSLIIWGLAHLYSKWSTFKQYEKRVTV